MSEIIDWSLVLLGLAIVCNLLLAMAESLNEGLLYCCIFVAFLIFMVIWHMCSVEEIGR